MHGNVWEWCLDGYLEAPPGGVDPLGPLSAPFRSFRGGCWDRPGGDCLSTSRGRGWAVTDARGSGLGFRVALAPVAP